VEGQGFCGLHREPVPQVQVPGGRLPEIQMLWRYGGSFIGTMCETNRYVKMYQTDRLPLQ